MQSWGGSFFIFRPVSDSCGTDWATCYAVPSLFRRKNIAGEAYIACRKAYIADLLRKSISLQAMPAMVPGGKAWLCDIAGAFGRWPF